MAPSPITWLIAYLESWVGWFMCEREATQGYTTKAASACPFSQLLSPLLPLAFIGLTRGANVRSKPLSKNDAANPSQHCPRLRVQALPASARRPHLHPCSRRREPAQTANETGHKPCDS